MLIVSYKMPKIPIDYSKTIIYKLVCNDLSVTDCYVGHTTNWIKRKGMHKSNCCNEKYKYSNLKVYQFIRENGGWDNWNMVQIEEHCCNNKREAGLRERYWYEQLNGTLNSQYPSRTQKEYQKEYAVEYYHTNEEKLKEYKKEWYETNIKKIKENAKEYRKANKDAINARQKQSRQANKEEILEKAKEYREANKEELLEYQREYRKANKDAINARQKQSRQAKKLNSHL